MFVINFDFIKPIEEVNKYTDLHRAYVSKQYENGTFVIGGPKKPRNGGIVFANFDSDKELCEILEKDPLVIHNVAKYTLIKFDPLMSTANAAFLLNSNDE